MSWIYTSWVQQVQQVQQVHDGKSSSDRSDSKDPGVVWNEVVDVTSFQGARDSTGVGSGTREFTAAVHRGTPRIPTVCSEISEIES